MDAGDTCLPWPCQLATWVKTSTVDHKKTNLHSGAKVTCKLVHACLHVSGMRGRQQQRAESPCSWPATLWPDDTQSHSAVKSHSMPEPPAFSFKLHPIACKLWCESWAIRKAEHERIDAFKLWCWRTLESPLDCKEITSVHPKRNQPWMFIGRTDAEVEATVLRPHDANSWLIGKGPDARKDWGQKEKRMTEDEMVGWHHWLNGHEFEQILGDSKGRGSLACCGPWGHRESDTTEWLNNYHLWSFQSPLLPPGRCQQQPSPWPPRFLLPTTAQHILLKCTLRCSHPLPEQCNSSGTCGRSVEANRVLMFSGSPWVERRGCQAVCPWISGVCVSLSVMPNSLWPHGLEPTCILSPWDSPGRNTGVGYHSLLQGSFPTQGSNPGLPHCRRILYCLRYLGSPRIKGRGWERVWPPCHQDSSAVGCSHAKVLPRYLKQLYFIFLRFVFWCGPSLKSVFDLWWFCLFVFWHWRIWDLISRTRHQAQTPCIGG